MVHHKMSDPPDRSPFQVLKHRSCCLRSGCLSRCWVTSCTRHLSALSNQPGCFPQFLVLRTKSKDDLCNCYMYIYMYICPCLCVSLSLCVFVFVFSLSCYLLQDWRQGSSAGEGSPASCRCRRPVVVRRGGGGQAHLV